MMWKLNSLILIDIIIFFFYYRRMLVNLKRDRTIYMSRILMLSLFVPFICAFLGHMKTDQKSIQDRIGLMYQTVGVSTYVGILIAVGVCKYIIIKSINLLLVL